MANDSTRYGKSSAGSGSQDQGERKDEGWKSRQGGDQSAPHAQRGEPAANRESTGEARDRRQGTGAGGFDRGVNATQIGAVYQGARPEEPRRRR